LTDILANTNGRTKHSKQFEMPETGSFHIKLSVTNGVTRQDLTEYRVYLLYPHVIFYHSLALKVVSLTSSLAA
jgi:hypothetical protein